MKKLSKFKLLYDAECPLCTLYSQGFVQTGMLEKDGREAFQHAGPSVCMHIDKKRACNEIALVNTETGEVLYGIDSIFKVITHSFPFLRYLIEFSPFHKVATICYSFISYNRKVIVPGNSRHDTCIPDMNVKYRWLYIIFSWLITSVILTKYSHLLNGVIPATHFYREFLICGGQILFQSVIMRYIDRSKILTYLGNMMTVSLAGALLLVIFALFGKLFTVADPLTYSALFLLTAGLMLIEHIRRMKLIDVSWKMSLSWVIYRVLVLILILFL